MFKLAFVLLAVGATVSFSAIQPRNVITLNFIILRNPLTLPLTIPLQDNPIINTTGGQLLGETLSCGVGCNYFSFKVSPANSFYFYTL